MIVALPFVASTAFADAVPDVKVRSVFLQGHEYPSVKHHLQMGLGNGADGKVATVELDTFNGAAFGESLVSPARDGLLFSITEDHSMLLVIGFAVHGNTVSISHPCIQQLGLSPNIWPYKDFPSYVPAGTVAIRCNTKLGLIDVQFQCLASASGRECVLNSQ
jgi:hypothetical protein